MPFLPPFLLLCQAGILLLLLLLAAIDLRHRRLPHSLTALLAALALLRGLLGSLLGGGGPLAALGAALEAGLLVALPFWVLRRLARRHATASQGIVNRGGVGGGDVRFAFAVGCLLGAGPGLLAAALATASLFLLGLCARLAGARATAWPLGPFLALPAILLLLLGPG
jgi:prepilin signal peptidase PulO-like enzyme (type II secretory pathway)